MALKSKGTVLIEAGKLYEALSWQLLIWII